MSEIVSVIPEQGGDPVANWYPNIEVDKSFDPWSQSFYTILQDGESAIQTPMDDINELRELSVYQAIGSSAQLGAAVVLLAAIFLMTKPEKRRSSVFILNTTSLFLAVVRGSFQLATITGPLYEWWRWKTHVYIELGNAKAISACSEVSSLLLTIAILLSLFVQVRIVCCNLSDARRYIINTANAIVIATAVAMRLALTSMNIKYNIVALGKANDSWGFSAFQMLGRFGSAANITLVLAIAFSTIIFTAKLAAAIISRRSMGITQFGPMQIIFIMGLQTMFTPLIFTIVTYTAAKNANVQSFVPLIVAISLPLSGMWAATNTENIHIANPDPRKHRVVPINGVSYGSSSATTKRPSATSTYYDDDKYLTTHSTPSPKKAGGVDSDPDLEMQNLSDGVNVQRTYSVRSD